MAVPAPPPREAFEAPAVAGGSEADRCGTAAGEAGALRPGQQQARSRGRSVRPALALRDAPNVHSAVRQANLKGEDRCGSSQPASQARGEERPIKKRQRVSTKICGHVEPRPRLPQHASLLRPRERDRR